MNNEGHRFNLNPVYRVPLVMMTTGTIGGFSGLFQGYSKASLQYLAENAHRLPKSKNGWYFYHKRKNYFCLVNSFKTAITNAIKLSVLTGSIFVIEAGLDKFRNCIDFGNTMMATVLSGYIYSNYYGLANTQAKNFMKKGATLGLVLGLLQDGLQYLKGDDVWYLRVFFGIYPRELKSGKLRF
ncbi:hypothetical protein PACTADRAFT_36558 [Pachysolen tannophilus NRRL Y-2460]|uniref:Uncharacterized protein n=1 Tax=Pachysolen tannophilus NRRL Y-2460 TaxID=669874 RepID=A0A1E4U393_PACTA|nr:hypothetical protein PACTADRAFT_36558 [Pachysolen tannophilus NRRL Y-2460]